jgi:hypothetical protein
MVEPTHSHDVIEHLRADLDKAREGMASLKAMSSGVAWGADPHGIVRAACSHDGRVVVVRLHPRWRSILDGMDLGEQVVVAVSEAARAFADGRAEPAPPATEWPDSPSSPRSQDGRAPRRQHYVPPDASPEQAQRRLRDLLNDVDSSMAALRRRVKQAAVEEVTGRNASGTVTATARGGALARVECSRTWVREATREQVQADLLEALTVALPGQSHRVSAAMRGTGRVDELLDLATDPIQLMAALGPDASSRAAWRDAAA